MGTTIQSKHSFKVFSRYQLFSVSLPKQKEEKMNKKKEQTSWIQLFFLDRFQCLSRNQHIHNPPNSSIHHKLFFLLNNSFKCSNFFSVFLPYHINGNQRCEKNTQSENKHDIADLFSRYNLLTLQRIHSFNLKKKLEDFFDKQ